MDSVGLEVLKINVRWLEQGQCVLLVVVVKAWGSSSRPEGAILALRDGGVVIGLVPGSHIEDDLIDRVRREGPHCTKPEAVKYGISAEEACRFGLPYGGTLQLMLEPLNTFSGIDALLHVVEAGQLVARMLSMATGAAAPQHVTVIDDLQSDEARLVTIHGPCYRMFVIGTGQLSHYLCQIAVGLDYQIIVCDPREGYSEEWSIPGVAMVHIMPNDTVMAMKPDERCAVIALTRDLKLDDLALMEALKTPVFHVGALGSRRNNVNRREYLKKSDLSDAELVRLYGPIGTYIDNHTPSETAISILVEVTAAKNGVSLPTILRVEGAKAACEIVANAASSYAVP